MGVRLRRTRKSGKEQAINKVVNNIETFARLRNELGQSEPKLVINTILMKDTQDEMSLVFRQWDPIVDRIRVLPVGKCGNMFDERLEQLWMNQKIQNI